MNFVNNLDFHLIDTVVHYSLHSCYGRENLI